MDEVDKLNIELKKLNEQGANINRQVSKIQARGLELNGKLQYIKEEEDSLPDFPSTSSIIKEHQGSRRKLTQKNAGAVALST